MRPSTGGCATGGLTVVDATNLTLRARQAIVSRAVAAGVPTFAIVLDLPDAVVLARNAARRDRVVPEDVVRRHLAEVDRILANGELHEDGFTSIVTLTDPAEVERLEIRRVPALVGSSHGSRARRLDRLADDPPERPCP